jgi:DNA-binding beta-propeller fold protein YncE
MAWDVTKLKLSRSKATLDGGGFMYGLAFGASGSKMYSIDLSFRTVREYDLGLLYDPFSETYLQEFSVYSEAQNPIEVAFNPSGTKMYVISISCNAVYEYNLSTPWNISTAVYSNYRDIQQYSVMPYGMKFKPDGTMVYVTSNFDKNVVGYSMSTAWDISTMQKVQEIDVLSICGVPYGIDFKPDGTKMYISCDPSRKIVEYGLTTAWNIESAKYIRSSGCTVEIDNVKFSSDGTAVYVTAGGMYEYTLPMGKHRPVRSS